uniref:Dual specificity protein phosphatase n=1 Tax=Clastoptera arizonana TaxID=38151 RepID=A0A1B6BWD5_9HEMI
MPSDEDESVERSCFTDLCVSKDWLLQELRTNPTRLIILDCRSSNEFGESHIRQAVNFSIPSIMLRRLAAGKIDLISTVKCRDLKAKITNAYKESLFVVYSDLCISELRIQGNFTQSDTMHILAKRLQQDGCQVMCLEDGFDAFRSTYPEWCDSCTDVLVGPGTGIGSEQANVTMPLMGLRSLRISAWRPGSRGRNGNGSGESSESSADERCDSSLGLEDDREFPVEILPYLFLGNAANSEDLESLSKHGIKYILNVTPDLPNVFEDCGSFKYMQIPIADHWSQNLASFFPQAIDFIEEARKQEKGVLVHCLAGVSRSVTITVAYLMARLSLSLNDAFNLVRSRKSNIAPNFHFMEQLHTFERELNSSGKHTETIKCENCGSQKMESESCKCTTTGSNFLSPLSIIGQSPDSGIEFDRWTPAPGE